MRTLTCLSSWKDVIAYLNRFLVLAVLFLVVGCAPMTREVATPGDPMYAPVPPAALVPPAPVDGSIYSSARGNTLFGDRTAHQVGDILTVVLQEQTQSSKSTEASITKDSDVTIAEPTILGTDISFKNLSLASSLDAERDFDGEAEADQSNSLTGNISVTVAEVLPNGLLRIRGEKWLTLTESDEYIRVSGLVRPEDIGIDNTILSTKIADARIAYSGTGDFGQVTKQGWVQRFFNSEWFPL